MSTALFLHGPYDARVAPFNLRKGRPGKIPLRVGAVGLCGSDLHYYKDGSTGAAWISSPFVPVHEFGGWLDSDVPELGLASGALVAVDPNSARGCCVQCRAGDPNLCPSVEFIGSPPFDGAPPVDGPMTGSAGSQAGLQFRPRFPSLPASSELVAEWGSKTQLGQVSVAGGSDEIGRRVGAILHKEGCCDGAKPLLQ